MRKSIPSLNHPILALLVCGILSLTGLPSTRAEPFQAADNAVHSGDLMSAISYWTPLIEQGQASTEQRFRALVQRGEAYRSLGHYRDAVSDLSRAMALADQSKRPAWRLAASMALGNCYLSTRRFDAAEPLLKEGLRLAQALHHPDIAAMAANRIGNLAAARQRPESAAQAYQQAQTLAGTAEDPILEATILNNRARIAAEPQQALRLLTKAYSRLQDISPSPEATSLLLAIGSQALRLKTSDSNAGKDSYPLADRALHLALARAEKTNDRWLLSQAQGELGAFHEAGGRLQQAGQWTEQAILNAQAIGSHQQLLLWEWQLARLLGREGNEAGALAAYRRSVYHIQAARTDIPTTYINGKSSFRETLEPVYLGLADLLLTRAGRETDPDPDQDQAQTQTQALLKEARDTLEQLKTAELRDYYQDPCLAAIATPTMALEQAGEQTAILYPIILPDRLELLLSIGHTLYHRVSPVSKRRLTTTARRLSKRLRPTRSGRLQPIESKAEDLYRWLIQPFEALLEQRRIKTLVFVPDGALRKVPMAVLWDGQGYLIERYAIATVPGMSLFEHSRLPRGSMHALLSGISQSVQGQPPLPGVKKELQTLSRILPGSVLLNDEFVWTRFKAHLTKRPYRIVHIASHGVFGGTSRNSYILTYDGRFHIDDLQQLLHSTQFADTPVELLTLSACETAEGDDQSPLGLSGAALKSGARSALGALWSVNDSATQVLIPLFYENLEDPATSKADALRQAQLSLLATQEFRHPHFWAPFVLFGNWF